MKKSSVLLTMLTILLIWGMAYPAQGLREYTEANAGSGDGVKLAPQSGQEFLASVPETAPYDLFHPEEIEPPENCNVPLNAKTGEDVEMIVGPWGGPSELLSLSQPSSWNTESLIPGATASSNIAVASLTPNSLVATWADQTGIVRYATWGAAAGWVVQGQLGAGSTDGDPVILSRSPMQWAVFARFGSKIKMIESFFGTVGAEWVEIPGITDALSGPVVVTEDAGEMGLFYLATGGIVKYTEWEGAWLANPISFGVPSREGTDYPILSDLSAVSRKDGHSGVFGVDGSGQLWYRERTNFDNLNWSDTQWLRLLEGVRVEKPGVTSRNSNHIGVAVRDSEGRPYYTRWNFRKPLLTYLPWVMNGQPGSTQSASPAQLTAVTGALPYGWSEPVAMGSEALDSPVTLAPLDRTSMIAMAVQGDTARASIWTEAGGWDAAWQDVSGAGAAHDQLVTGVFRQSNDAMLLERRTGGGIWFNHYTALTKPILDSSLSPALEGVPRGQALAVVGGRWVWVTLNLNGGTNLWEVQTRELNTGINASLTLTHSSDQAENRVSIAAAELDLDGNDEVVIATLHKAPDQLQLSVLELSFPTETELAITATPMQTFDLSNAEDVNVAIGELNGNPDPDGPNGPLLPTNSKEVVVGYQYGSISMRFDVFTYNGTSLSLQGGETEVDYKDWCGPDPTCLVLDHDFELAIGRVYRETVQPFDRQQVIALDVAKANLSGIDYALDQAVVMRLDADTWSLEQINPLGCSLQTKESPGNASPTAGSPYSAALGTGDMGAVGLENIVYTFGDQLAAITKLTHSTCEYQASSALPDTQRSLVLGDIDVNGRSEAGVAYRNGNATGIRIFNMREDQSLGQVGERNFGAPYTLLVGDTDNDTFISELVGCKTDSDRKVVAVVNSPPRWYSNGAPIQESGGLYGRTESSGGGSEQDGSLSTTGASATLGLDLEFDTEFTPMVKDWGFRLAFTYAYQKSTSVTTLDVSSTTREEGYEYNSPTTLGMVVYNSTEFTCFYYEIYSPKDPLARGRSMVCTPTGRENAESFESLEIWRLERADAGPSWVDIGHRTPSGKYTNDLDEEGNYPYALPVEPSRLKYTWDINDPFKVSCDTQGGFESYWHVSEMIGSETEAITATEHSFTPSIGFTIASIIIEGSYTYGFGEQATTVTSWEKTVEIGGRVEKFQDPTRLCYDIVPYVHMARARTQAGVNYDYLELDYYVPNQPYNCSCGIP